MNFPNNQILRTNKSKLIKTIFENIKQFSRVDEQKDISKPIIENLKNFSIEEFSKFFQVLANTQHLLNTDAALLNKNKDFIFIDDKVLDYNEKEILSLEETKNEDEININKFIKRNDLFLNNLIKEKLGNTFGNSVFNSTKTSNQSNSPNGSVGKIVDNTFIYENTIKNIKKRISVKSSDGFRKRILKMQNLLNLNEIYGSKNLDSFYNGISENITNLDEYSNTNFNTSNNKNLELNEKSEISEISDSDNTSQKSKQNCDFLNDIKKFVKLHIKYIYTNNLTNIEKEDKIILDFLFENINEYLYEIIKFWLYQEFLSISASSIPSVVIRFDTILNEIILRLEKQEILRHSNFTFENLYNFLSEIPQYNEKVIDFLIKHYPSVSTFNDLNFSIAEGSLNATSDLEKEAEKNDELFINLIFLIYKKIKKKLLQLNQLLSSTENLQNQNTNGLFNEKALKSKYSDLLEKLKLVIFNLSSIDNEKILKARIKFISTKIFPLENKKEIHELSKRQFESLIKYTETPVNNNFLLSKYGLYFYLSFKYPDHFIKDFITECPKIYNQCTRAVCEKLDKIIERSNLKALSIESLINFVKNCADNCTSLVLLVMKNIKSDIGSEKLYKEILNFYHRSGKPLEILLMLSLKINNFFIYVYEKIRIFENFPDDNLDLIFNEINNNAKDDAILSYLKKDENINQNLEKINSLILGNIKDKIIFYIIFFIEEYIIKKTMHINKLNFFIKYLEKLSIHTGSEKLNENLNYLLELIKLKNISDIYFFQLTNYFLDYFKDSSARKIIMSK